MIKTTSATSLVRTFALLIAISCQVQVMAVERQTFTVADHQAFVLEPPESARTDGPMPWVWYAPTLGRNLPGGAEQWMFDRLHAAGIAIAGVDVGESYGSPNGRAIYQALYQKLTKERGYSTKPVLLARSRGGLMLYSWAVEHPESVGGVAGIYPVCNIASYPGIARAAPAFGMTTKQLEEKLAEHNPVDRLERLAAARVPIFHLQGDSDRVVPHEKNSGLLAERYKALGGPIDVELIKGQGHNMWRGWFESQRLTDFMIAKALGWPEFELAAPFTDNAVFQRQTLVPVWGRNKPRAKVTVAFAGQKKTAVADQYGDWMVKLDPMEASRDPRELKVTSGSETITLSGVLVGEVWFSSGQSNMVWTAGKSMCSGIAREIAGSKTDIPIREININTVSALYPQKRATSDGGWKTHKEASNFSALSLSFAYELYKELDMPIGILLSAHSNTRIEAFTQRKAIENHSKLTSDADLIRDADPTTKQGRAAFDKYYEDLKVWQTVAGDAADAGGRVPARSKLPGIAGMWRGPSQFFNGKINPVIPYAIRGAIWCQGTSNSGDGRIYAARMEALVNGWRDAWAMPEMPFYFTQMQCYGSPDPNSVGFADIRQVQHMYFMNNRQNVGMVVQSDLNSARPQGIHYFNKLHPGMRMARWALAKQYGKDIAYTGPIYTGYVVKGDQVIVSFEKGSLFGGLMIGSKGSATDYREEGKYVEPAKPTPNDKLNHFRLCGKDKVWHAAQAVIVGDTVVVTSESVPKPIGVQYAYSGVPENSNLYNQAGLPATPFAAIGGKLIFEEDDLEKAAALKAKYAQYTDPDYLILQVVEYFRDGAIIQRNKPIPVWGHANKGVKVTVTLGGITKSAVANDLQQWSVEFPAFEATTKPITLSVSSSHGFERTVNDILVGDLWYLTGSTMLNGEMAYNQRNKDAKPPAAMPLVREFRRKTKASSFPTPRRRKFETGGGKYRSSWMTADLWEGDRGVTMFAYHFAKTLNREGIPQGFITMSSGHGGRARQMASPLSWTSFQGVKDVDHPAFQARLNELFMQYPNTAIAKKVVKQHVAEVKEFVRTIVAANQRSEDLSKAAPLAAPPFPEAGKGGEIRSDTIPTYAYNWCVSPMTPMAVAGVIWVPSENNIGYEPALYASEMEIFAKSLPDTYGQDRVQFIYAQPAGSLIEGITNPKIPGAKSVTFDRWPKRLKEIAIEMAKLAE